MKVAALIFGLLLSGLAEAQTVILYSHRDKQAAERISRLVQAYDTVQIDSQLPPGVLWREQIQTWICSAERVLLVWSQHAAASNEVRAEIDTALHCRTPISIVLLDSHPLPGLLSRINAINWQ